MDCESPKTVYGRRSPGRRVNRPLGFGRRHVVAGEGDSELGAWKARSGWVGVGPLQIIEFISILPWDPTKMGPFLTAREDI